MVGLSATPLPLKHSLLPIRHEDTLNAAEGLPPLRRCGYWHVPDSKKEGVSNGKSV